MSAFEKAMELLRMGEGEGARRELEQLPPGSAEALYGRGLLADLEGDIAQAELLLAQAHAANPAWPELACDLAMLLLSRGEDDAAARVLEPAFAAHPDDDRVNLHVAMALAKISAERARACAAKAMKSGDPSIQGQARALYSTLAEHSG